MSCGPPIKTLDMRLLIDFFQSCSKKVACIIMNDQYLNDQLSRTLTPRCFEKNIKKSYFF
jgi:hypothetical protein